MYIYVHFYGGKNMEGTQNKYLIKLGQKCNLTDEFLNIIDTLFDKLYL